MTLNNMNLSSHSNNSNNNRNSILNQNQTKTISFSPNLNSNNNSNINTSNAFFNSASKGFPVIFVPKSSMSNYYQPKYRSQFEEERRIKQQYLEYIHRVEMETLIHQNRIR